MLDNDQLMDERFYVPVPKEMIGFAGIDLKKYICVSGRHIKFDLADVQWETIAEKNYFPFQKGIVTVDKSTVTIYKEHHKSFSPELKELGVQEDDYFWLPALIYRLFTDKKEVPQYPDFKDIRTDSIK